MRLFIYEHFEHFLSLMLFISRMGDIISTYLATPTLKLESNPIVRKLGWPFAWFGLLICIVPYYNTLVAVTVLVPSLLVCASNFGKVWMLRTLGEQEWEETMLRCIQKGGITGLIATSILSAIFVMMLGGFIMLLYADPGKDWGFWIGYGFILYGIIIILFGVTHARRLARKVRLIQVSKMEVVEEN